MEYIINFRQFKKNCIWVSERNRAYCEFVAGSEFGQYQCDEIVCPVLKKCEKFNRLIQFHHQFKHHTVMVAQDEFTTHDNLRKTLFQLKTSNPCPEGAIWMMCNEKSEHFTMTINEAALGDFDVTKK